MVLWHPRSQEMRHKPRWAKWLAGFVWDVVMPVLLTTIAWFLLICCGWWIW